MTDATKFFYLIAMSRISPNTRYLVTQNNSKVKSDLISNCSITLHFRFFKIDDNDFN